MKSYFKHSFQICTFIVVLSLSLASEGYAEESVTTKENIEKLKKTKNCRECDLSGANLSRFDLSGADLEGADLSQAKLFLTNLSEANLQNANLSGAIFGGADLGDADLRGADLRGASLDTAYLGGTLIDGEFVSTKPYESSGISDIEKVVYVEDLSKPKKKPEAREIKVASRRDLAEPPPAMETGKTLKEDETTVSDVAVLPQAPVAKKTIPLQKVAVEEQVKVATVEDVKNPVKQIPEKKEIVTESAEVQEVVTKASDESKKDASHNTKPQQEIESAGIINDQVVEGNDNIPSGISVISEDLALNKAKKDNLARLEDKNKCYGCDLSGIDLSDKDLENADLEKADLTGCNLEGADLGKANLKGAKLLNANLRNASLKNVDLYKADLSGADLTDANVEGALFDSANMSNIKGYSGSSVLWKK